jgi:hypothetical protein
MTGRSLWILGTLRAPGRDLAMFAPGGVQHLLLEVIAYAADKASRGRRPVHG